MFKGIFSFIFLLFLAWSFLFIRGCVRVNYEWENKYGSFWELADRSSTLEAKANYINLFVQAIESNKNDFAEYNAIYYPTLQNKTQNNIEALKTLQKRLSEIKKMKSDSFEYNQAIQQITAQEQDDAKLLISDISGSWFLQSHKMYWNWIGGIMCGIIIIGFIASIVVFVAILTDL